MRRSKTLYSHIRNKRATKKQENLLI